MAVRVLFIPVIYDQAQTVFFWHDRKHRKTGKFPECVFDFPPDGRRLFFGHRFKADSQNPVNRMRQLPGKYPVVKPGLVTAHIAGQLHFI